MSFSDDSWLSTRNKTKLPVKQGIKRRKTSLPKQKRPHTPGISALTQTSPPPKELFTAKKQSKLSEFFGSKSSASKIQPQLTESHKEHRKENILETQKTCTDELGSSYAHDSEVGVIEKPRNYSFNQAVVTRFCNNTDNIEDKESSDSVNPRLSPSQEIKDGQASSPLQEMTDNCKDDFNASNRGVKRLFSNDFDSCSVDTKRVRTENREINGRERDISLEDNCDILVTAVNEDNNSGISFSEVCTVSSLKYSSKSDVLCSDENRTKQDIVSVIAIPRNSSLNKAGVTRFCNNTDDIPKDTMTYDEHETNLEFTNNDLHTNPHLCQENTNLEFTNNDLHTNPHLCQENTNLEFTNNDLHTNPHLCQENTNLEFTNNDSDTSLDLSQDSFEGSLNLETQSLPLQKPCDRILHNNLPTQLNLSDSESITEDSLELCTQFTLSS